MAEMHPNTHPRRLLLAVGGDHLGQWLPVGIARAFPDTECRFIGQLWSDGHWVRAAGYHYSAWPLRWAAVPLPASIQNHTDFHIRNLTNTALPPQVRRAYAMLHSMAAREMDQFRPDAVISLTADMALSHLFDQLARDRGITAIGLQTSYLRQALLVHTDGANWWKALRDAELPATGVASPAQPSLPMPMSPPVLRRRPVWMQRTERLLRTTLGAPSFDTLNNLRVTLTQRGRAQIGGFPDLNTPNIGEQPPPGLALVALHRPVLQVGDPDWIELLRFALTVTPPDWPLVVRPHPAEPERPLPDDLVRALSQRGAQVSRPGYGASLDNLLKNARLVITLNSATGFEALCAGVPTVTLAPAFYARTGMGWGADFRRPEALQAMLARGDVPRPDVATVRTFAHWIRTTRSAALPPVTDGTEVAHDLAERICSLIRDSK